MGTVKVTIRVNRPQHPERAETCEVLADAGATLTVVPEAILNSLGIVPEREAAFDLANGLEIRRKIGQARIALNGDDVITRIVFGEPGDSAVLGLTVLEEMGLAVDPVQRRLIPSKYLLL